MAVDSMVRLGGIRLRTAPDEIRWNFSMKANDAKAIGGKVIQICGLKISDITIKGTFTPDKAEGDEHAYQQLLRFRSWVDEQTEATKEGRKTLRFTYAPRGWDFNVFIKSFNGGAPNFVGINDFAPKMEIALFPVDDTSRDIVKGIRDLYIKRLLDGVGWKQTDYNGPTQQEVDDTLAGRSVQEYLADQYEEAAYGSTLPDTSGGGGFGGGGLGTGTYAETPGTITYGGIQP
jgi:hypothetical protein